MAHHNRYAVKDLHPPGLAFHAMRRLTTAVMILPPWADAEPYPDGRSLEPDGLRLGSADTEPVLSA
jgi:hypothetical protein